MNFWTNFMHAAQAVLSVQKEEEKTGVDSRAQRAASLIFAALAYCGPGILIALFMTRNNRYVRYHVCQAVVPALLFFAVWLTFDALEASPCPTVTTFWGAQMPYMWTPALLSLLHVLANLSVGMLAALGIRNAVCGYEVQLPVMGKYLAAICEHAGTMRRCAGNDAAVQTEEGCMEV